MDRRELDEVDSVPPDARRLCEALGIEPDPGVVRVSAVHYNGDEDVERLVAALETVL